VNGVREICHCGHDKATHFENKHTCLASACSCRRYRSDAITDPEPAPVTPRRPARTDPWRGFWGY
jgi:hypothetical protein